MKTNRFPLSASTRPTIRTGSLGLVGGVTCAVLSILGVGTATAGSPNASGGGQAAAAPQTLATFSLQPNAKFARCLAQYPDDASRQPHVDVAVMRGAANDLLAIRGEYIKPNLKFDMFTIENDPFKADGTANPDFKNFGFAWYQSDLEANDRGVVKASIRTILLDQIFGFDPAAPVGPTNTFEVGFWFNDPNDAAACGFDVTQPTPFNGQHKAGPLAAISLPSATTGLGPLCTNPDTSVSPARCNP
jgi:hypothetical protein